MKDAEGEEDSGSSLDDDDDEEYGSSDYDSELVPITQFYVGRTIASLRLMRR